MCHWSHRNLVWPTSRITKNRALTFKRALASNRGECSKRVSLSRPSCMTDKGARVAPAVGGIPKTDRRYVSVSVPQAISLFVAACFQYPTVKRWRTGSGVPVRRSSRRRNPELKSCSGRLRLPRAGRFRGGTFPYVVRAPILPKGSERTIQVQALFAVGPANSLLTTISALSGMSGRATMPMHRPSSSTTGTRWSPCFWRSFSQCFRSSSARHVMRSRVM
jgi:hypothetical protein